jgi:hypothetical protein
MNSPVLVMRTLIVAGVLSCCPVVFSSSFSFTFSWHSQGRANLPPGGGGGMRPVCSEHYKSRVIVVALRSPF